MILIWMTFCLFSWDNCWKCCSCRHDNCGVHLPQKEKERDKTSCPCIKKVWPYIDLNCHFSQIAREHLGHRYQIPTRSKFYLNVVFRSKSNIIPLLQLEVPPERVTFMEELGRGAFGKVHKGVLRELPRVEVFFKPKEQRVERNEGKVVAIKVLLGEQMRDKLFLNASV